MNTETMPHEMEDGYASGPMSIDELTIIPGEDSTPHQIGMQPYDDDIETIDSNDSDGQFAAIYDISDNIFDNYVARNLYEEFDNVNLHENVLDRIILYTIDPVSSIDTNKNMDYFECPICYEEKPANERVVPSCQHSFCKDCIIQHLNTFRKEHREATCAYCRDTFYCMEILNPFVYEEVSKCIRNIDDDELYVCAR